MRPEDYLYIRAWGKQLGSFEYYIRDQQEKAAREKAPRTSIYKSAAGNWVTYGQIVSKETKASVRKKVEALGRVFV